MKYSESDCPTLAKAKGDYLHNYRSRKEICICLSIEEIQELMLSKQLDRDLQLAWHFKFYLRQLLLASTATVSLEPLKEMLWKVKTQIDLFSDKGVRALLVTLNLKYFISSESDYALCQIFDGSTLYDEYCAQIAYEEYQRREQHPRWQERSKKQ